jgi:signal transduction histidine kinase
MADTILRNMEELKQVDNLRRDLIANISHDIRTPIAIIHGYVETLIMKHDTLDGQKQSEYLQTIIKSTERLKRLMSDLFELSKLESPQIKPRMEPSPYSICCKTLAANMRS